MNRSVLNFVLAGILAMLVAINWFGARDYRQPNYEFMPNMVHTARYDTFAPNPNFADGKTLQMPPPGTIPHGTPPLLYQATPQDAERAGIELKNPLSATKSAALDRGATLFGRFCQPCHGSSGAGDGLVAKHGFPPPPTLAADHARQLKDGQIFHIITFGQRNMPSYGAQISADDRWQIVLRVRQIQQQSAPLTAKAP